MSSFLAADQNDFIVESKFKRNIHHPEVCPFVGFPAERKPVFRELNARSNSFGSNSNHTSFDGVILRKDDMKVFPSKLVPGSMVAVQRFVIRTSGEHWTALSCWGSPGCLAEVTENLHVGDSVCVLNPREKFLQSPMNGDKSSADPRSWLPSMPCSTVYDISIDMGGQISTLVRQDRRPEILAILQTPPLLNTGNVFPLGLLQSLLKSLVGQYVNFVGIIKEKGRVGTVTTKFGSRVAKIVVRVFDTDGVGLNVTLWGQENSFMAARFVPLETIVLFSEVLITIDSRNNLPSLASTGKTLLTPNPRMPAADALRTYLASLDAETMVPVIPAVTTMTYVNCQTVSEMMKSVPIAAGVIFTGRLACHLTAFNLDGPLERVVEFRCATCQEKAPYPSTVDEQTTCGNGFCPEFSRPVAPCYHILCDFSDGSGTVKKILLTGAQAEAVVGVSVSDFLKVSLDARADLKWIRLFEVVKIAVAIIAAEVELFKKEVRLVDIEFV